MRPAGRQAARRHLRVLRPDVAHLAALAALVEAGRLSAHVQSVYDLEAVQDAVGEASGGKVVLRVP